MQRVRNLLFPLILGGVLFLAACSGTIAPSDATQSTAILPPPIPSPTSPWSIPPTLAVVSTATQSPSSLTATPTLTPSPALESSPSTPITPTATLPSPVQAIQVPPEIDIFLLVGSDNFSPYAGRTDSLMLVFLNSQSGNASVVSIPRDLYVYLPGKGMDRINSAYALGGMELLYQTLEYNLGVRPHHWALAHLDDFIHFVDDLGGIEVDVDHPLPDDCGSIPSGLVQMDGVTALCYVRERRTTNDIDRSRRQQEVLRVVFDRFMSLENIPRLPEWYLRYNNTVRTDVTLADLLALAPFALRLQYGGSTYHYQVGWTEVISWRVPENGAAVLLPNQEKIMPLIQQAVDVLLAPSPASGVLETRIAELTASPTPAGTPTPDFGLVINGSDPTPDAQNDPNVPGLPEDLTLVTATPSPEP